MKLKILLASLFLSSSLFAFTTPDNRVSVTFPNPIVRVEHKTYVLNSTQTITQTIWSTVDSYGVYLLQITEANYVITDPKRQLDLIRIGMGGPKAIVLEDKNKKFNGIRGKEFTVVDCLGLKYKCRVWVIGQHTVVMGCMAAFEEDFRHLWKGYLKSIKFNKSLTR
jgi:hypothetical protein